MEQIRATKETTMNKATTPAKALAAKVTTMVTPDGIFAHDPATVGHRIHTADCWTRKA
jgi:hypothetical protein